MVLVAATEVGVMAPRVNVMAGVVVGFATVPLTPLAVTTEAEVTVPPLPDEVNKPPALRFKPVPTVISEGTAAPAVGLPISLLAVTFCILAYVTAFGAMVVAFPTEVISPVELALVTTVVALPTLVTIPVRFALVVTVAAFPPILKLATGVVEFTTSGAVPVATVEVS